MQATLQLPSKVSGYPASNDQSFYHLSPISCQGFHKFLFTCTAQHQLFAFYYRTVVLNPVYMLQINQISFISSAEIHP